MVRVEKDKPLLVWTKENPEQNYESAILGDEEAADFVRFDLIYLPTCYRRGKWKLMVEVCGGEHHHDWGCFDEQNEPIRWYHREVNAKTEAELIAQVLFQDRITNGRPHPFEVV